jgi:hypothetical protein
MSDNKEQAERYYGVFGCGYGDKEDNFLCFKTTSREKAIESFIAALLKDEEDREIFVNLVVASNTPIEQQWGLAD